jgi:hypothetical protein
LLKKCKINVLLLTKESSNPTPYAFLGKRFLQNDVNHFLLIVKAFMLDNSELSVGGKFCSVLLYLEIGLNRASRMFKRRLIGLKQLVA